MAIEMRQDGGWAWCICVGSFLVSFVASVYLNCGGVVLSALVDNYGIPRSEAGKSFFNNVYICNYKNAVLEKKYLSIYNWLKRNLGITEKYKHRAQLFKFSAVCESQLVTDNDFAN